MELSSLQLENFRRFKEKKLTAAHRTVILGDNGSGKSTLLEAIRVLSVGKSFRTNRFDELIHFQEAYLRLQAVFSDQPPSRSEFFYGYPILNAPEKERQLKFNNQPVNLMEYLGKFASVLFVPTDIEIVLGSPSDRRRYLDGVLWQVSPEFRQSQLELTRVLRERSALLFLIKIHRASKEELQPWNELLVRLTQVIRAARRELVEYFQNGLDKIKTVTERGIEYGLSYQAAEEEIEPVAEEEIKSSQNIYGPHRDDIDFYVNNQLSRRFSSRGQARTLIALCKTIESQFLQERLGQPPIILLDDIFSELDERNAELLLNQLPQDSQQIVTAINAHRFLKGWKHIEIHG